MRRSIRLESLAAILIIVGCLGCSKAPSEKPAEELREDIGIEILDRAKGNPHEHHALLSTSGQKGKLSRTNREVPPNLRNHSSFINS